MTRSRQEEINLAKEIINDEIKEIYKAIDFANELIFGCKNEISYDEKYKLVKTISNIEYNLRKSEIKLCKILDSLATATEEINKKKFLLINSGSLISLKNKINELTVYFYKKIHSNFFGVPKGQLTDNLYNSTDSMRLLFELIDKVLTPSVSVLENIKSEILKIEDWLKYKQYLREMENEEEKDFTADGFEKYYHATDYVSNFRNNLLNRKEDVFFARNPATAIAQKMGFSGSGSNLTVVEFKIAKSLNDKFKYVQPYSTDSYADADTECFYIDAKHIDAINEIIKSGKNLISIKIFQR